MEITATLENSKSVVSGINATYSLSCGGTDLDILAQNNISPTSSRKKSGKKTFTFKWQFSTYLNFGDLCRQRWLEELTSSLQKFFYFQNFFQIIYINPFVIETIEITLFWAWKVKFFSKLHVLCHYKPILIEFLNNFLKQFYK